MTAARVRMVGCLELSRINALIDRAVSSWETPDRVKRLALPVYRYSSEDLTHMWLMAAESRDGRLLGVAALEEADEKDLPEPGPGLLLHGIFVDPDAMGLGVGRVLLETSAGIARAMGCSGLLVKAVRQSRGFFERCGLVACPAVCDTDYPYRYWMPAGAVKTATPVPELG